MSYDPYAGFTPVSVSDQMCTGGYGLPSLMVRHDPMDYGNSAPKRIEAIHHNPRGYSTPTHHTFLSPSDSHYNKASEALRLNELTLEDHIKETMEQNTGTQLLRPIMETRQFPLENLHKKIMEQNTGRKILPPIMESKHLSRSIDLSPLERRSIPPTPKIEDFIPRKEILYPPISRSTPNSNVSHLSERMRVVSNVSERGKVVGNVSQSRVRMWNVND